MAYELGMPRAARLGEKVALDLELFKPDPERLHLPTGQFACLAVAFEAGESYLVTDAHDVPETLARLDGGAWVMQNALFDLAHLRRWAKVPQRQVWDTMLVEQDLFGGYYDTFALDDLARRWLDKYLPKTTRDDFLGRETLTKKMMDYSVDDAQATIRCAMAQWMWMVGEDEDLRCYFEIDEPALWAVLDLKPQRIDVDAWLANADIMAKMGTKLQDRLGFNVFSGGPNGQVVKALAKASMRVSASGNETLEALLETADKKQAQLLTSIIDARRYRKAASTYGRAWVEKYVVDGYVTAGWRITGAETGRMACRSPALQTIPTRHLPIYRTFFIASPGHRFLSADVSQQEPRFTAYFSQDRNLLAALRTSKDIYVPVARDVLGSEKERRKAKDVFLGTTYNLTAEGLSKKMHVTLAKAQQFMKNFRRQYSGLGPWQQQQARTGRRMGYVRTISGRRVWLNPYNYQHDNNAVNGPIQGSAADHAKLALATYHREAGEEFFATMVIHDEITADPPTPVAKQKKMLEMAWKEAGRQLIPDIPISVDVFAGQNWGEKK